MLMSQAGAADPKPVQKISAWQIVGPLGTRQAAEPDTLMYQLYRTAIPSAVSPAFATTGAQESAGEEMIYWKRDPMSAFFLNDAKRFWTPSIEKFRFYNSHIPMSLVSYNTGGSRETTQDHFKLLFSGNVNPRAQIGTFIDYPYSKGSYNYQASKGFTWGANASYLGDKYDMQVYFVTYNFTNKENGGITDDLYIIDPAEIQGGYSTINTKSIPTNLTASHSRTGGVQFYLNNRYKLGFWREETDSVAADSVATVKTFVPVSSFVWTFDYRDARHRFSNTNASEEKSFWENHYFSTDGTDDLTSYSSVSNTLGVQLLEGFNKYAKAGLAAFLTYEYRRFHQATDTLPLTTDLRPAGLSPYPFASRLQNLESEHLLYAGAQLSKQQGSLLRYDATVRLGIVGAAAGEIDARGSLTTRFRLRRDSVAVTAYGAFSNTTAPLLMQRFISNHFAWENDFNKTRRLRLGGKLSYSLTGTSVDAGIENVQNLIYFGSDGLPRQAGSVIQVFSLTARQDFKWRALNWRNSLTVQTSTDESVLPLPKFAVYSNLYLQFKVARVLTVQLGVDMDYYTAYNAPTYQPSTMTFCTGGDVKVGNYPYMNAYANFHLSKARFYVEYAHANQGLFGGNRYFSLPHYPLNPHRFLMGVAVDFAN